MRHNKKKKEVLCLTTKKLYRHGTGKSRLLKIAFENMEQKVEVLRAKVNLKRSRDFKSVYHHTDRILELNAKTLLSELPNGN